MEKVRDLFKTIGDLHKRHFEHSLRAKHYPKKIINKLKESYKIIALTGMLFLFALAILVGGIIYTTSPVFCKTCHVMQPFYDDWSTSSHAEIGCVKCHLEPGFISMMTQRMATTKNLIIYFITKKGSVGTIKPTNEMCLQCHIAEKAVSPAGDLIIPHPLHVKEVKITCAECHVNVVHHRPKDAKRSIVTMETCYVCHDGTKATDACEACHAEKGYPDSHKVGDWLKSHGEKSKTEDCSSCHAWRPDWCAECHEQKPASHIGRWRTNHKLQVEAGAKNCLACHDTKFCVRCHGVMPSK